MRHNASTVVVLAGRAPGEVLAALGRSMNVALIRPDHPGDDHNGGMAAAADALRRAGRTTSPYALVPADPLASVAESWRAMWDVSRSPGPDEFEREALQAVTAWRAGLFELPDYYLVLAADTGTGGTGAGGIGADSAGAGQAGDRGPDFYLGPLRSVRPHRVAVVAATEPTQQAAGVLHALGSLRHGPWWPGLAQVIDAARGFYPDSLAGTNTALIGGDRPQTGPSALRCVSSSWRGGTSDRGPGRRGPFIGPRRPAGRARRPRAGDRHPQGRVRAGAPGQGRVRSADRPDIGVADLR